MEHQITNRFFKANIEDIKGLLPPEIKKLIIKITPAITVVSFINEDNIDVVSKTHNITIMRDNGNVNLYEYIIDCIKSSGLYDRLELNKEYPFYIQPSNDSKIIISRAKFIDLVQKFDKDTSIYLLARKIDISKQTIYNIINNKPSAYSIDTLIKMCLYFKVTPYELFTDEYSKQLGKTLNQRLTHLKLADAETSNLIVDYFCR